ncbi:efflux transporter periplasmic adaptor subunit [Hahella sp. CCB-MM4]|uniref:efflux RND transporter periplasmic adaptor subunit n=1 Tax=Hahella sp. (strain CCB-MM4) TaxID=1926491 RepID=UPI000B9B59F3|nr:efflux RND transporter periplasmic adaptor subunit [Hahella sp. CCB-MM4]OZG75423.1 efflux transporter periplasmic adaptor subunit [Hahella sp. CCB-MM4]
MKSSTATLIVTAIAVITIPAAVAFNSTRMEETTSNPVEQSLVQHPQVGVIQVTTDSYQASVKGYGEAKPQYQLSLTAEVSGQITSMADSFATGMQIKQGEEIVKLDTAGYEQAVASAEATLADARLALLEEDRQGEQARLEWQESGLNGEPESPLVLRQPQREAAEANVNLAQKQLKVAQRDLEKTSIKVPFDAIVVSRDVQPGSYVQTGNQIGMFYSTDRIEIQIPLSAAQWIKLPEFSSGSASGWPVTLISTDGKASWQGSVSRVQQHISSNDRQRSLIVSVENPLQQTPALFPGTFVEAQINGRKMDNLWRIPASAITQENTIWYVDTRNQLQKFPAEVQFSEGNFRYVKPALTLQQADIVVRPLNTYLTGMVVEPKNEG